MKGPFFISAYSKINNGCPGLITSPLPTLISLTMPFRSLWIGICIFIDSSIMTSWPDSTLSSLWTNISAITPVIFPRISGIVSTMIIILNGFSIYSCYIKYISCHHLLMLLQNLDFVLFYILHPNIRKLTNLYLYFSSTFMKIEVIKNAEKTIYIIKII